MSPWDLYGARHASWDYDLAARGWFGRDPIRENPAKLKLPFGFYLFYLS
jgi:hypothetical protein